MWGKECGETWGISSEWSFQAPPVNEKAGNYGSQVLKYTPILLVTDIYDGPKQSKR